MAVIYRFHYIYIYIYIHVNIYTKINRVLIVLGSVWEYKRVAAGRVEQVTAIYRFNIMEFRTGLFIGDRYRQVTVI